MGIQSVHVAAVIALASCSHPVTHDVPTTVVPEPHTRADAAALAVIVDASVDAEAPPDAATLGPRYSVWWLPRRPLPKRPSLEDVVCFGDGQLRVDAVPDPDAPSAVATGSDAMRVCTHGTCRDVAPVSLDGTDAHYGFTDGTYLAIDTTGQPTHIYRVADAKLLYHLTNTYEREDPDEFACGVAAFFGDTILALGHDCSGPIAMPWLLDARTGRPIARVNFHGEQHVMDGMLRAVHLDGDRWAVMQNAIEECYAMILDARTGRVEERLVCTPTPARLVGKRTIPFTPVACPADHMHDFE